MVAANREIPDMIEFIIRANPDFNRSQLSSLSLGVLKVFGVSEIAFIWCNVLNGALIKILSIYPVT